MKNLLLKEKNILMRNKPFSERNIIDWLGARVLARAARRILDERWINLVKSLTLPVRKHTKKDIKTPFGPVTLYFYWPFIKKASYPLYVNIHGGGFITGYALDDDNSCRRICEELGAAVLNIEYALSPEARFPTALEQCYEAVLWALERAGELAIDTSKIMIGGHSAGGNLTAALCLLAKERQEFAIIHQTLLCPLLDIAKNPALKNKAVDKSKIIPNQVAKYFKYWYLHSNEDPRNPFVSPVYASQEQLEGLPPAIIITAANDNLWEEGSQYAQMLGQANVKTVFRRFLGVEHPFVFKGPKELADEAWGMVFDDCKIALNSSEKDSAPKVKYAFKKK